MKITSQKHIGLSILFCSAFPAMVNAETAFFDGSVMHVPELLVFQEDVPRLLQQVELQKKKANNFELLYANEEVYAAVQSIATDSEVVQGDPIIIHIAGEKSLECVTLNRVSVSRVDNAFHLTVTEQPVPAHVSCFTGVHPFQQEGVINTSMLDAGHYDVYAHGLHIEVLIKDQD